MSAWFELRAQAAAWHDELNPQTGKKELSPKRGKDTGEVAYRVATERESEAEGLAQEILARRTQPGGYSQHAVLARTHGILRPCRF